MNNSTNFTLTAFDPAMLQPRGILLVLIAGVGILGNV